MQDLALHRRFRCIFLAGPTFNLLPTDEDAAQALRKIRVHLEPDGSALVPLFVPTPTPPEGVGRSVDATESDGAVIRVTPISELRDEGKRTQLTVLRYERVLRADHIVVERPWILHWHTEESFRMLAATTGLETVAIMNARGSRQARIYRNGSEQRCQRPNQGSRRGLPGYRVPCPRTKSAAGRTGSGSRLPEPLLPSSTTTQ